MNLEQLIALEERFQPHVPQKYYTVVAPVDDNEFTAFVELAHKAIFATSVTQLLSNRQAIHKLLTAISPEIELQVFLIYDTAAPFLIKESLEDHIEKNGIDFQI